MAMNTLKSATNPELEFTDAQLQRLDELQEAAANFFQILADTDDMVWDLEDIYELLYDGADMLVKRGRRVKFPTHVTENDGTERITDWYEGDEPDC